MDINFFRILHIIGCIVTQWLIGVPYATSFLGCISNDEIGMILADKAKKDQVVSDFYDY